MADTDRGQSLRGLYSSTSNQDHGLLSPTLSSSAMKSTAKKPGQVMADAAATAEFNEKRWFWLPDEKKGYLACWIIKDSSSAAATTTAKSEQDPNPETGTATGSSDQQLVEVRCVDDKTRTVKMDILEKMNPPKFNKVEDIADLTFLNEPSVVHNLRQRYESKMIYTYSGLFLVAINPYHPLPIYTPQVISQYKNKRREENPPHVYAVAERSWQHMLGERENQSILITGESGAGKTENTKRVISYLTAIASAHKFPASGSENSVSESSRPTLGRQNTSTRVEVVDLVGKRLGKLERQILQANPILESFGNAQTVRNNNSSRFGKFVRIEFNALGAISGANIDWYLLEKSRVTSCSEKERAFHIFYQLLIGCSSTGSGGGGDEELAEKLLLNSTDPKDYNYLNKTKLVVDGMDDLEEWRNLRESLNVVGLSTEEQLNLFKIISIILHIGNIAVQSDRSDVAYIHSGTENESLANLEQAFHLLGLPNLEEFKKSVLRPKIKAGREFVTQQRNAKQVKEELSSLCTTLYEKSFGKLIDKINAMLDKSKKGNQNSLSSFKSTFIGVLDIAGFEIFETNGFEQLCINYTNERLQQFFNHHMFVLEQEEYSKEDIDWDFVNFGLDLQPTIDLIESSSDPIGILSCLDEECIMPRATDLTFTEKLMGLVAKNPNPKFIKSRFNSTAGFIIQHYAGHVEYRTEGWLEKNKDPLNSNLTNVLASSNDKFIATLFEEYRDTSSDATGLVPGGANPDTAGGPVTGVGKRRGVKRGAFRTVGQRHKEQLTSLMNQLQSTQPHFVRCIVPNPDKRPGVIDVKLVLDQLRCNGVLEGIRIARLGYPNRLPFIEFRQRYEVLTPGIIPSGYLDGRKACIRMLGALDLDESVYKIGLTKVFFKSGVLAELEERRDEYLYEIFTNLQANCRSFIHQRKMKKVLNKAMSIRTIQRNARIYNELKSWPWWQLYTRVRPLLAATRDDNELRKKANELNQLKEKNEKERQEREKLEAMKNAVELEKQRVENELEQERLVSLNKEEQLIRSKEMEMALVEELEATRKELEALEDQFESELKMHHATKVAVQEIDNRKEDLTKQITELEAQRLKWADDESRLKATINDQQHLIQKLEEEKVELNRVHEDLKRQQAESEEDLERSEKRLKMVIAELEGKLEFENDSTHKLKNKIEQLEKDYMNSKIQLGEMKKTIMEYESKLKHKEAEAVGLENQKSMVLKEKEVNLKRTKELEIQVESLDQQLNDSRGQIQQHINQQQSISKELDETRALLETKCSEEHMMSQVSKAREEELGKFREQQNQLLAEMSEIKRQGNQAVADIKSERDEVRRQFQSAHQAHNEATERITALTQKISNLEVTLQKVDRAKQAVEIELQEIRSKHLEATNYLDKTMKEKEGLEKQLSASVLKFQDMEDAMLKIERERSAWSRQVEDLRSKLEVEMTKRVELEHDNSSLEKDLKVHKDTVSDHEKNSASLRKELTLKNQELHKAISLQDKTIVEHVHVLEEAKKYTDRQLSEAQALLRDQTGQLKLLDRTVARLKGEAEDLTRELQKEKAQNRQSNAAQHRRVSGAHDNKNEVHLLKLNLDKEKIARGQAEANVRKLQTELQKAKEGVTSMGNVGRRSHPENTGMSGPAKKEYENRISDLERQLQERDTILNKATIDRVKKQVEQRYTDLIHLVQSDPNKTENELKNKLLAELQQANQELEDEMASSLDSLGRPVIEPMKTFANGAAFKRNHGRPGSVARMSREIDQNALGQDRFKVIQLEETIRKHERATHGLQADLQVMSIQQIKSDVIRNHLESQLNGLLKILNTEDSNQSITIEEIKRKLNIENEQLQELLKEEIEARSLAEQSRLKGSQNLKEIQNSLTNSMDDRFSKLESNQFNLLSQNRASVHELENQKSRINELQQTKTMLETELMDYKQRCDHYAQMIEQEAEDKRQMLAELQEAQIERASSGDLENALVSWKQKADQYRDRVETAEVARLKAEKSETFAKVSLVDSERRRAEAAEDREAAEQRARVAEQRVRELEAYLEDEGGDFTKAQRETERTLVELNELRAQYDRAMNDRDYTVEATRQRFQHELENLAKELESERERTMKVREELRQLRTERDELQIRNDERLYSRGGFSKEKERLETKVQDITKAYDEAVAAQAEQSSQIVTLMSQVRDLRAARDEAEADRAALVTAKKSLEQRLEEIGSEFLSANSGRLSNDRVLQTLQQERSDLKRELEEKEDLVSVALERQKKAEAFANDCQMEANRERSESSELLKANTELERKIKLLNLKIVDLETRSMTSSPRHANAQQNRNNLSVIEPKQYEEVLNQLEQERENINKLNKKSERSLKDLEFKLVDSERSKNRLLDEIKNFENKLFSLRKLNSDLQSSETESQLSKRRAEREVADLQEKISRLQVELERYKSMGLLSRSPGPTRRT
ncbi:hypothetical protein MJO29_012608 [Puccinia striiformis f. sp. tritici]|uniref:hypothetical protein n=1 Tax=Puccinia striiformis f. sp. tritici TaxID=168172 RepID=UPI0020074E3E|nr:hypothetical protein Pst134EA_024082 [Puccinia striiformis f. sp. tritici]KAH9453195.1 hypothetical protein Pst134EA_024082 [Puccinia striiformis f. sp. tritici]KAI7942764.1 hypothetical protein MJO29_012608 [Puccinia striiformis f. sp. tritici]